MTAKFNGVSVPCPIDTGSMVSFITEAFYREYLRPACGDLLETNMLTIKEVNGLEVPYTGYLKVDVTIGEATIPERGIMILKETRDTVGGRRHIPGLLGSNILDYVPKFTEVMRGGASSEDPWEVGTSKGPASGFVRVAGTDAVWIPPNMVCDVLVSGPACGERAIVEPLSVAIEGNLQVANILVNATKTCYTIQVANPTSKDNWLKPRTRLGTIHAAEQISTGT